MFPRDMVCLRNISVDTLHKGDTEHDDDDDDDDDDEDDDDDDDDDNNNNNRIHHHHYNLQQQFLWNSRTARSISVYEF